MRVSIYFCSILRLFLQNIIFGFSFTAYQFRCSMLQKKKPSFISVVSGNCQQPDHILMVKSTSPARGSYSVQFTVCLMPLNFNYSRSYELVEWIELNRILGAERFTIYVHSSADNVERILSYYKEHGLVEVIRWPLPVSNDEVHYFGQVVALQDCLYRNKATSEYVVNLDLDEFVIPHRNDFYSWKDIVANRSIPALSFIFKNTFFRKEWLKNYNFTGKEIALQFKLITLLLYEHETTDFPYGQRSKFFAKTSQADSLMIHDVKGTGVPVYVPSDIALLHHYRNWLDYTDMPKVKDETLIQKYGETLLRNVKNTWKQLPNVSLGRPDETFNRTYSETK